MSPIPANTSPDSPLVAAVFGTRPEAIKFGPVLAALEAAGDLRVAPLVTGQQPDLLPDFLATFGIRPALQLAVMVPGQDLAALLAACVRALTPALRALAPRAILVQGDTTSALAGALVGATEGIPVVHIEAGLRSGNLASPYPEEANRILITHAASLHCAPTAGNCAALRREGVPASAIVQTGNPVVDAVLAALPQARPGARLAPLLDDTHGARRVVLTTHRRENFGHRLTGYLDVVRAFVERVAEVALICPVHPNPAVRQGLVKAFGGHPRVHLIEPLGYHDFLSLVRAADLVLSDSGGIQEEIAVLGTPLIILRDNTERPEILATGRASLAADAVQLERALSAISVSGTWPSRAALAENPFGDGRSAEHIAAAIRRFLAT